MSDFARLSNYIKALQKDITAQVADLSGTTCREHHMQGSKRENIACLGQDKIFERYAVNITIAEGKSLPDMALPGHLNYIGEPFKVLGLSMIFHPVNPYAPTMHANIRFFQLIDKPVFWFGGGLDLTPAYVNHADVEHWHQVCHSICEQSGVDYDVLKRRCDEYFYLPHRKEHRGVGGLFFEHYTESLSKGSQLITCLGDHIMAAYLPIIKRRADTPYTDHHKAFQMIRRGRYVEFNLLYDRGTHFGFQFKADPDTILVSMPPSVSWDYHPDLDEEQSQSVEYFLEPKEYLQLVTDPADE
jgi:coproporphyrinogen III oxidase|tara:strand:- start:3545 stop:4444 length:900 start_codon:yes stop_codon:yes gene_type:complete